MEKFNNGFINDYKRDITVLSNDYPAYLNHLMDQFKIPENNGDSLNQVIDWSSVQGSYSFYFGYEGSGEPIARMLANSLLATEKSVIVEMGPDTPVIEVKTDTFIHHWDDFFAASGFMGTTVIGRSGKCFLELTDRNFMLFSNFPIAPA